VMTALMTALLYKSSVLDFSNGEQKNAPPIM